MHSLKRYFIASIVCVGTVMGMSIRDKSRVYQPDPYQACIDSQLMPHVSGYAYLVSSPFIRTHVT